MFQKVLDASKPCRNLPRLLHFFHLRTFCPSPWPPFLFLLPSPLTFSLMKTQVFSWGWGAIGKELKFWETPYLRTESQENTRKRDHTNLDSGYSSLQSLVTHLSPKLPKWDSLLEPLLPAHTCHSGQPQSGVSGHGASRGRLRSSGDILG